MKKTTLLLLASLPLAVQAANTEFSYSGFIKLDAMVSQYSDGNIPNLVFYIPSQTPVETATSDSMMRFDATAKTSRLNLKALTTLESGEKITGVVEFDFNNNTGSPLTTNGDAAGLRHAYLEYQGLTLGQTWSTFMNPAALPESTDFIGPSEGAVFVRQAQVRYSTGSWQFAAEKSETSLGAAGVSAATTTANMPDLVARYNLKSGNLDLSAAALLRSFAKQYGDSTKTDEKGLGLGLNLAGTLKVGADDVKFSATYGQVARYVGLAMAADAIQDTKGDIQGTNVLAAYLAYRHFWNNAWRSSLIYSIQQADYDDDTVAAGLNENAQSLRLNLMYSATKELTTGCELSHAQLEKVGGAKGDFNRLQFSAKYAF